MADNMIELVASLNVDDSAEQINKVDIPKLQPKIKGIKIKCELDTEGISSIQSQLANISKNSKLDILKVEVQADTRQSGQNIENVAKSVETVTNKVLTLKKTLADLDNRFVEAFKAVENPDGIINAERTMAVIQSRLSSLGTVTVTGKYNDQESEDSINKIIARIEAASGEVRELNFLLDSTGQKFEYIGGSYSDKGVGKIQQDLARLSKELANFEASHKSIESGLIEPLTTARNAIIDLESGVGSVESAQKALDNLKTVAANIGSNLKSTGSSFNVFDNAANKAKNFDNTIKTLKMDIESLSPSTSKSSLVSQLDLAIERMNEFKDVESKSGRGVEWSQRYGEISSLLQNITNNLKVAQKEENAFNKEFEQAVREEEKQLAIEQKRVETARQLREEQQHDYWQGRFEESVKGMTAENQVLKDMKKYYEDLNKAQKEVERQEKKTFQEDNKLANLQNRIKRLTADINSYASANKRAVESTKQMTSGRSFADEWSRITSVMAKGADLTDRELKDLSADMAVFRKEAQAAGLAGESAFGKFLNSFKTMSSYITANMVFNFVKSQIRDMVNEVTAIDTAMTELRKVTEATNAEFEAFAKSAGQTGRELGASISDVINATSTFSRAGFNLPDAEELGKVATLYKNVGDGITIDSASESIISVMKAFNIEAENSIGIIDRINEVSNRAAIDSGGLGLALQRVASAMDAANNSLDETIALTTVSNEIVQNPEMVAQGWRTVALRIRGAKSELEDAGLETEGMVESTAKLRDLIKGISGVDIMLDENTFKSTYQIIDELGRVWDKISDIDQASLLEAIAGKRQSNIVAAALNNYERLDEILKISQQSAGSAMREQEEYAKSIQYSIDTLKASYQDLSQTVINSDFVKTLLSGAQEFLEVLTAIIDKFGAFPTLLASIGAVGSFNKMGFFKVVEDDATKGGNAVALFGKKLKDVIKDYQEADAGRIGENKFSQALSGIIGFNQSDLSAIEKYNSLIESGVDKTEAFEKSMLGASNGAKSFVQSSKTATVGITGLSISEKAATIATDALGVALNTALSFGIGLLIQAIITGITKLVNAEKEAQEKAEELRKKATETAKSYKDEVESLSNLTSEYIKLATTTSDLSTQKEKLLDIQDKINDGFATEKEKVDLLNGSLSENIRLLDEQEYKEAKKTISDLEPQYEEFQKLSNKEGNYFLLNDKDKKNAKDVAKNIEREFVDFFNATTDYYEAEWIDAFTGEQKSAYVDILSLRQPLDEISVAGQSYAEVLDNLNLIIDSYREWEGHNNDTLESLNALRDKYDELAQSENEVTTAYEAAQKSIQDYNDAFNSDASQRISEILEDAKELSTTLNSSTSGTEKYYAIQQLSDLEKEARQLAGTNTVLKNNVDSVFNAINTGSQSAIESFSGLRSAWFESLDDIQKNTISNIDKMDKAIKTAIDGGKFSSSDFWELAELDTDDIIKDIKLVNGEYQLSENELIRLKDEYIQKQIESLRLQQRDIESKKEAQRQALILAQQELDTIGKYNSARYGSANLNNPKYREYTKQLEDANSKVDTIKNNIKELGDNHARNNILLREYNSRLGYSAEQASALAEAYHQNFVKAIDDAIDKVNDRKQALEDEKDVLNDEKDILNEQLELLEEQQKTIEEQIENYKTVVGVIEEEIKKQTDALKEQQEAEEEIIQAKIDALKEEREQKEAEEDILEKELAVQEKLRDLEKAKNTKVRTFSSARGWHYDVDKEAVANAQSALTEAQKAYDEAVEKREYENKIKLLEEEKEAVSKSYEERIEEYEDYTEQWKSLLEEQSKAEEERLADEILGVNWREKIKSRDVNILNSFKTTFKQYNTQLDNLVNGEIATLKKSIKAKEDQIAAVDAQIKALDKEVEAWNKYKQDVEDAVDTINNKYSNLDGVLATTANDTSLSLDNMEIRLWDFKEHYKSYMDEAIAKANEFAAAASQEVDTGWMEDITGKVYITLQQWQDTLEELSKYNLHINSNGDAELHKRGSYANGGVVDYTGVANVHGTPMKSEVAFNSAQAKQLYNMVRTGSFENLVASKAIEGFRLANVATSNNNNNSTSVNIQNMNINGVQNPTQFAKEFNRNMEQYLQNEMIKSRVR